MRGVYRKKQMVYGAVVLLILASFGLMTGQNTSRASKTSNLYSVLHPNELGRANRTVRTTKRVIVSERHSAKIFGGNLQK